MLNLFYSECGSFCQNCTSMFTCNRCKSGFYKMKSSITRMERCTRRCPYGYKNETGGGVCTKGWSAMFESHYITSHHITSHHITSHRIASHRIASHRITSHRIASHRITSHHKLQSELKTHNKRTLKSTFAASLSTVRNFAVKLTGRYFEVGLNDRDALSQVFLHVR